MRVRAFGFADSKSRTFTRYRWEADRIFSRLVPVFSRAKCPAKTVLIDYLENNYLARFSSLRSLVQHDVLWGAKVHPNN